MATNYWGRIFRYVDGTPMVGKGNTYFQLKTSGGGGPDFYLTESDTLKGFYGADVTTTGVYELFVDGTEDTGLTGDGIYILTG